MPAKNILDDAIAVILKMEQLSIDGSNLLARLSNQTYKRFAEFHNLREDDIDALVAKEPTDGREMRCADKTAIEVENGLVARV